ncbi:MAG: efflux RND transporter permease subunit [bacterium]
MANEQPESTGNNNEGWVGPIEWMVRNSIAANLFMAILLAGGIWMAFSIQKEVFPQFTLDVVNVSVQYPGASPREVEQGILLPVEEALRGIQGIKEMSSTAREGSGSITLELLSGVDRMKTFQEIDQEVSRIRTFPDEAEEPEVRLEAETRDVIEIGLSGGVDKWILRKTAENLRDQLLQKNNITQVQLERVPNYVTHVRIPQSTLRSFGLTLEDVARKIEQSSRDIPAGDIDTTSGEILLRVKERKQWAEEFSKIPIVTTPAGAQRTLGELADVEDGFEETTFYSGWNGEPNISMEVFRVGDQTPLGIAKTVKTTLRKVAPSFPSGIKYRIDSNRAEIYYQRLNLLLKNGFYGIIIVLVLLSLFLEYRLAFWVMMGMTISFVGSILFLPLFGVSINMISMFAFLVVLGIVVDDAIIVGENVYEYRQRGMSFIDAAIQGTKNIAGPVTFSILTNVVAFLPLFFVPGVMGNFWWPIPAVVICVLILSLFEALFILPAHLGHSSDGSRTFMGRFVHDKQQAFASKFHEWVNEIYRPFLRVLVRNRYVTLTLALVLLLVVGGYAWSDHMGMIMMPEVSAEEIEVSARLPQDAIDEQIMRVQRQLARSTERVFEEHNLDKSAEGYQTQIWGTTVTMELVMKPPGERKLSVPEVTKIWRKGVGSIPGVRQLTFESERGPGSWRDDISVDLNHSSIETLERASQVFFRRLQEFESTRDVNDSYEPGKEQLDFKILPEGRSLGLTASMVGRQVRGAFYGVNAMRQLRGTNEVEVRVKFPENQRDSLYDVEEMIVRTPDGTEVPLMDVVRVEKGRAFESIDRRNGRRIITVGSDVEPKSETSRVVSALKNNVLPNLRAEFPGLSWSFEGSHAELRKSTKTLWMGFALAMFVVYALLAIAFESYTQPLIVMSAIPFGIIGAVLGHIIMGFNISLISLMGVIALSGVVVNDSLIMVDYANRRRKSPSVTPLKAILQAGARRFRPILLTTLTTFGGLTPMILETSRQAQFMIPMAVSLGFGILFATSIILVLVPCLYMVTEDIVRSIHYVGTWLP